MIIVLNNAGGNIFNWIDGPTRYPNELHYFTTPQNINFQKIAALYDVNYLSCSNFTELNKLLEKGLNFSKCTLLEIIFEADTNLKRILSFRTEFMLQKNNLEK